MISPVVGFLDLIILADIDLKKNLIYKITTKNVNPCFRVCKKFSFRFSKIIVGN